MVSKAYINNGAAVKCEYCDREIASGEEFSIVGADRFCVECERAYRVSNPPKDSPPAKSSQKKDSHGIEVIEGVMTGVLIFGGIIAIIAASVGFSNAASEHSVGHYLLKDRQFNDDNAIGAAANALQNIQNDLEHPPGNPYEGIDCSLLMFSLAILIRINANVRRSH